MNTTPHLPQTIDPHLAADTKTSELRHRLLNTLPLIDVDHTHTHRNRASAQLEFIAVP